MSHDTNKFLGRAAGAFCAIALLMSTASPFLAQEQKPPNVGVVATLPKGAVAEKAATACTECHDARIILQQRLGKAAWTREVDKMVKWGAFVEPSDRDALIDYLGANFGPDQPPYQPPRTSVGKSGSTKASK